MKEEKRPLNQADLYQFTGTTCWYRHPLMRKVLYTEGVQYVAEHGQAHWLLDEIVVAQLLEPKVAAEEFQLWKLSVEHDQSAVLSCEDGNLNTIYQKALDFTDFPLAQIKLYFTNNVILLPSEY